MHKMNRQLQAPIQYEIATANGQPLPSEIMTELVHSSIESG